MKRIVLSLVAASSLALMAQAQEPQSPRDDGYRSAHVPKSCADVG